jgi:hypothetical protein
VSKRNVNYKPPCSGQSHPLGCRPVLLLSLLVDHLRALRCLTRLATTRFLYAGICSARCCDLLTSSKFPIASFNLFSSLWWTPIPRGI